VWRASKSKPSPGHSRAANKGTYMGVYPKEGLSHLILEVTAPAGDEVRSMWSEQGTQENPLICLLALINGHFTQQDVN